MRSSPYCVITLLDIEGKRLGKSRKTGVKKDNLNPDWTETMDFDVLLDRLGGLKLAVWDKHKFRTDKFMGQALIKFNTELLLAESIDDYFQLEQRKGKNEVVSGSIGLKLKAISDNPRSPSQRLASSKNNTPAKSPSSAKKKGQSKKLIGVVIDGRGI